MKNEIIIPSHFPELKGEDLIAADERRDKYSIIRDLKAKEFNDAILLRMAKEKELLELSQSEDEKQAKCEKCGKELSVDITSSGITKCSDCS